MKFLFFLLAILQLSAISANELELDKLRQQAYQELRRQIRQSGDNVAISYIELGIPKYLVGAQIGLRVVGHFDIVECENIPDPITGDPVRSCRPYTQEKLDPKKFKADIIAAAKTVFEIPFIYNLKLPIRGKVNTYGDYALANVGLETVQGFDPRNSEFLSDGVTIDKSFISPHYTLTVQGVFNYAIHSYVRTQWETLKEVDIGQVPEGRTLNGRVEIKRLGPGINQTDVQVEREIQNNRAREFNHVITGDYLVTVKGVFCGCDYIVSQDSVIDTVSQSRLDTIYTVFPEIAPSTKISGRLVAYDKDGELRPVKNTTLKLKPSCDDADQCMNEVEDVTTDSDGHFEFTDVPKGGYAIIYKDLKLKEILNCDAQNTGLDYGDLIVTLPLRYDIEMEHHGKSALKHLQIKWEDVLVRPLSDTTPLATMTVTNPDVDPGVDPVDDEGNPLTVPYRIHFPQYPTYDKTIFGVFLADYPTEIKIEAPGMQCHLEQSLDAPTGIYLEYGDLPSYPYARPMGHHLELDVSLMCNHRYQEMFQFMTGHRDPGLVNHYADPKPLSQETINRLSRCEDFELQYKNRPGEDLTIRFHCKGLDTDDSEPCDDFSEDCGEDRDRSEEPCDEFSQDCGSTNNNHSEDGDNNNPLPPGGLGDASNDNGAIGEIGNIIGGLFDGLFN